MTGRIDSNSFTKKKQSKLNSMLIRKRKENIFGPRWNHPPSGTKGVKTDWIKSIHWKKKKVKKYWNQSRRISKEP